MPVPGLGEGRPSASCSRGLTPSRRLRPPKGELSEGEDVDFQRFDRLADTGETAGTQDLTCRVLVNIRKIAVIDWRPSTPPPDSRALHTCR